MRILICIVSGLFAASLASAEVYRWTDENGVVHFSDRPQEGAEVIEMPQAQTFEAPPVPQRRSRNNDSGSSSRQNPDETDRQVYGQVSISSPAQDEVLRNTGGAVPVAVNTVPSLRRGHKLIIFLDGQPVETLTSGRSKTQLSEVFRGQHSLKAQVRAADDQVVGESDTVTFTVQQTSIQSPSNPLAPPVPTPLPR